MRPVEGQDHLWYCAKHGIYAQLVDIETAEATPRSADWTGYPEIDGIVVRHGDERQGGQIIYFREK